MPGRGKSGWCRVPQLGWFISVPSLLHEVSHHLIAQPLALGVQKGARVGKPQGASTSQTSACVIFANVPLAKEMASPVSRVGEMDSIS